MNITLNVYADAYAGGLSALDENGEPQAYVPRYNAPSERVGATLDEVRSAKLDRHVYVGTDEIVTLYCTDINAFNYYRSAVQDGHLVAADEATAKLCGVEHADAGEVREASRKSAFEAFQKSTGRELPERQKVLGNEAFATPEEPKKADKADRPARTASVEAKPAPAPTPAGVKR